MSKLRLRQLFFFQLVAAIMVVAVACNSKATEDETEIAVTPAIVAVKKFSLQANDSVMAHLDSVAFSIDLNTGVIFNPDSLPKGTDVSRLVAAITFANTMTKAELSFLKDDEEKVTVNYLTNPEDSIDFTYPVNLDVTAQNGENSFSYQIKVNVHQQAPDTLMWANLSTSPLPSRFNAPVAQKTVLKGETAYSIIEEYNGEYTLSSCSDLNLGEWQKQSLELSFSPLIDSFTATDDMFWLLSDDHALQSSSDGLNWNSTEETWVSVTGSYANSILGIKETEDGYVHTIYPQTDSFIETNVEPGFPLYHSSSLGSFGTKWSPLPFAILTGGETLSGELSSSVWAFDGNKWAVINEGYLPALESPMLARYVVFRDTPYLFVKRELDIWILFGGIDAEGEMNRKVYMSYDNGVNWRLAPESMQLPENFPVLSDADVIVAGYDLTADLSEAWTPETVAYSKGLTRSGYQIDGFDITWNCPYLYVFGGYSSNNILSTSVWRGVLARLQFTPLI